MDKTAADWSAATVVDLRGAAVVNTMLATLDCTGQGRLWDLDSRSVLQTFQTDTNSLHLGSLAFSRTGERLAWVDSNSGYAAVWDVAANRRIASFDAEPGSLGRTAMTSSHDGSRIATANAYSVARVWSAADGSKIAEMSISSLDDWPEVAFARDDEAVLAADGTLDVFDARKGLRNGHWMMSLPPSQVVSSPRGDVVAIATTDGWLTSWIPETGRCRSRRG